MTEKSDLDLKWIICPDVHCPFDGRKTSSAWRLGEHFRNCLAAVWDAAAITAKDRRLNLAAGCPGEATARYLSPLIESAPVPVWSLQSLLIGVCKCACVYVSAFVFTDTYMHDNRQVSKIKELIVASFEFAL